MTGTDWILWQEIGLVIVFSRLKHETHVEYSTVWGLRGHFRYQKKFLRHFFKNPLPQFCRAWSGAQIKYPQHGHISWIEGYKNSKVKKNQNLLLECTFEIIGFKCWLNIDIEASVGKKLVKNRQKGNCWPKRWGVFAILVLGSWYSGER